MSPPTSGWRSRWRSSAVSQVPATSAIREPCRAGFISKSLSKFDSRPVRTRCLVDANRAVQRHARVEFQQIAVAQADAAMGAGHAQRLAIRRAMQIDIAAEGIDLAEPVAPRLAAAQPENAREDPVAPWELRMQLGRPDLAGPAPASQYRSAGQAVADLRPHLVQPPRRAARAIAFARPVDRRGNGEPQRQLPVGETVEDLVGEGDVEGIEGAHGALA